MILCFIENFTMIGAEIDGLSKNGIDKRNEIIQKYEAVVESLQEDLKECKIEQTRIRTEINDFARENNGAVNVVRDAFHHVNNDGCQGNVENLECIDNLQRQIAIIQLEKDSMYQLWQMSLKAVDVLEQELKETHKDGKTTKYYEEQVNHVKETYSEAIKALEIKLLQAKDNFMKQQNLWQSTREQINKLTSDKSELERHLIIIQNEISLKEQSNLKIIEELNCNLTTSKQQIEVLNITKMKLENELMEMRCFNARIVAKEQESEEKIAEAIELVETAMREKDIVLQREAMIIDEKTKLEARLANLSHEFVMRLDKNLSEAKESFERNIKTYISEIKELKAELRDKATEMDRIQHEYRLVEEELNKMRHGSEHYLERSSIKVLEFEQKLKESQHKLEICEETMRRKFEDKIRESENKIIELEEKLANANDRLRRNHLCNAKEVDDRIRESDDRIKETAERYSNLEKRLIRALDERESVTSELRSIQLIHDREVTRKENERRLLENRIRELQDDVRNAHELIDKSVSKANVLQKQVEILEKELETYKNHTVMENGDIKSINADKSIQLKMLQEKYEEKISELTKYVKVHQKLSSRWKEEAQSLASKFHDRYKELRSKVNVLKKENEILNNELICWRQVDLSRVQVVQRYDQGDSAR